MFFIYYIYRQYLPVLAKESTIIIATHDNDYLDIADKAYELNEGILEKLK